jgi:hypothetical protein
MSFGSAAEEQRSLLLFWYDIVEVLRRGGINLHGHFRVVVTSLPNCIVDYEAKNPYTLKGSMSWETSLGSNIFKSSKCCFESLNSTNFAITKRESER